MLTIDCHFYALNASNGSLKWNYQTDSEIQSKPSISEGIVYFDCLKNIPSIHQMAWFISGTILITFMQLELQMGQENGDTKQMERWLL